MSPDAKRAAAATRDRPADDELLDELFARHIGQWLIVDVTERDEQDWPIRGRLVYVAATDEELERDLDRLSVRGFLVHRPGDPDVAVVG